MRHLGPLCLSVLLMGCATFPAEEREAATPAMISVIYHTDHRTLGQVTDEAQAHCASFGKNATLTSNAYAGQVRHNSVFYRRVVYQCVGG